MCYCLCCNCFQFHSRSLFHSCSFFINFRFALSTKNLQSINKFTFNQQPFVEALTYKYLHTGLFTYLSIYSFIRLSSVLSTLTQNHQYLKQNLNVSIKLWKQNSVTVKQRILQFLLIVLKKYIRRRYLDHRQLI